MNIDIGVQAMLKFCLSNLNDRNVGIIDGGFMNYAVWMDSDAMMYVPSFRLSNSKVNGEYRYKHTDTQQDYFRSLL
jgi:hypothetical protein